MNKKRIGFILIFYYLVLLLFGYVLISGRDSGANYVNGLFYFYIIMLVTSPVMVLFCLGQYFLGKEKEFNKFLFLNSLFSFAISIAFIYASIYLKTVKDCIGCGMIE